MTATEAAEWVEAFRRAWMTGDPQGAAALFTPDAVYRSHPFRGPLQGRAQIAEYWADAVSDHTDLDVVFGDPVVAGDRVAVEWWARAVEAGRPSTDCGALILSFAGSSCRELREYWNLAEGHHQPPERWGT